MHEVILQGVCWCATVMLGVGIIVIDVKGCHIKALQ